MLYLSLNTISKYLTESNNYIIINSAILLLLLLIKFKR